VQPTRGAHHRATPAQTVPLDQRAAWRGGTSRSAADDPGRPAAHDHHDHLSRLRLPHAGSTIDVQPDAA
jgi:hypothetical protein